MISSVLVISHSVVFFVDRYKKQVLFAFFVLYLVYSNRDLIRGEHDSYQSRFSLSQIFSIDLLYDMKQELVPLLIAGPLFIAARLYNNHLDKLELEYIQ